MDQAEMAVQSPAPYASLLAAVTASMSLVLFCAASRRFKGLS